MPGTLTSLRLDRKLADEVKRALGVRSRTEAVHIALQEIVRLNKFKKLMKKYGGKLQFAEGSPLAREDDTKASKSKPHRSCAR